MASPVFAERRAGAPVGSRAERLTAFSLDDIPVPTGREEEWRFSPIHRLEPLFQPAHHPDAVTMDVALAPEVRAEVISMSDGVARGLIGRAGKPGDRAAVAAWNAAQQAVIVTFPVGV
jgi:Fe-S cluster assembly protein SufD